MHSTPDTHWRHYLLSQFFVFGLQVLAVAAPGSIELNEDIFAVVVDDGVKVLSNHHLRGQQKACQSCLCFVHI